MSSALHSFHFGKSILSYFQFCLIRLSPDAVIAISRLSVSRGVAIKQKAPRQVLIVHHSNHGFQRETEEGEAEGLSSERR